MTNGDRIRQMSNEELAEFLASKTGDYLPKEILEWLKNEWQEKKENVVWNGKCPF